MIDEQASIAPWDATDYPMSFPRPHSAFLGVTQHHYQQLFPGLLPGLPGTTTIVFSSGNGRRTVFSFRRCFGTRARLHQTNFPEIIFISHPLSCSFCSCHICTFRFHDFRITNFHLQLTAQVPREDKPPGWRDLLVTDESFFLSHIRPFLTYYPVLRSYENLGNIIPLVRVYTVSGPQCCHHMPLTFQHTCRFKTLDLQPVVLR